MVFLLCAVLERDVEGRGAKLTSKLLRALLCDRIPEGAVWRGIDHLGCSGLLGRFVEGGVQRRGLHVIGSDLRRQDPPFECASRCPP